MTQSIPFSAGDTALTQSESSTNGVIQHKRLMELVEAEDAANGEVGCGRDWGEQLSVYLHTSGINISDENFRTLLREHLGHLLMERDFDSITTQVSRFIESKLVQVNFQHQQHLPVGREQVVEYISDEELRGFFQAELGEFCNDAILEQIIQFTHNCVHKAVLQPRHTWPKPLWVLTTGEKIYIAQASDLDDAITKVKAQYPQETGTLSVLTVGGVLGPEPVICLERAN
ncbi:hypothetical protein [Anabaena catenula]|uniref:Uncharacterized protein n=1 Tax=Anabaena catenula FACHB-362 TaxID=2692877 RepID=A0ABR8J7Z6_9NOST|nr:hypothetical protein [Anabaena catenula]MBD2694330.1 hypothetical protein [Anabaena catenula FACHB-362]